MANAPETATFSIERDGQEYDVEVPRDVIGQALGQDDPSDETMAGWLQDNLAELSDIAHRKLDDSPSPASPLRLTAEDWAERTSR